MTDGAVLGVHDGMVIEYDPTTLEALAQATLTPIRTLTLTQNRYDPTTLAPLGMVVSKDELMGRKVGPTPALILGP